MKPSLKSQKTIFSCLSLNNLLSLMLHLFRWKMILVENVLIIKCLGVHENASKIIFSVCFVLK